jgi:hypothetical protein
LQKEALISCEPSLAMFSGESGTQSNQRANKAPTQIRPLSTRVVCLYYGTN